MMLALDNLVDNAIRYSTDGRWIRVAARREGQRVIVEIQDRGNGISEDELSKVRRKFVRGRLARADSSGLGLAIASRIVSDHKGTFALESQLGQGTTARASLPIVGD
jgi:signal transduction histidine kinase